MPQKCYGEIKLENRHTPTAMALKKRSTTEVFFHKQYKINCDQIKQQRTQPLYLISLKEYHSWDLVLIVLQLLLE